MSTTPNQAKHTDGTASASPKRASLNSTSKNSKNQRSSSPSAEPAPDSVRADNPSRKRATSNSTSKNSKNQRSTPPDVPDHPAGKAWTTAELLKRAADTMHSKPAKKQRKRGLSKDYFDRASTKKLFAQCDELLYGPMRHAEEQLRKEEEKIKAQVRSMNLRWRLDSIDAEFNRIHKEIDTIVKVVMRSYGCHRHRGEWRRSHCGRKKRLEQNTLIKNDLLRARHVAKHGPARPRFSWDYYLHPQVAQTVSLRPDLRPPIPTAPPQVAQTVSLRPDSHQPIPTSPQVAQTASLRPDSHPPNPTAPPSAARECSPFSQTRPNSFFEAAAPPTSAEPAPPYSVPYWSELPYYPSLNPLFARAMDGTTFLSPRPFPPELPDTPAPPEPAKPHPLVRPKRRRRPSERQVRKLYEVALSGPPPGEDATRYTDARVFLAEIGPLGWQRYGSYFYDFFKRRKLDRAPKSPRSAPRESLERRSEE